MSKNWQRPTRRDALLQDREGAYAIARHVRMSPQKVRRVVDMVRGMPVQAALDTLRFAPQAASEPVYKVIASAVANAENTENLRADDLFVSQIFVDEGVTMRRIRARAKGSAARILKRASHITAVVEPEANRGPIPVSKQAVTMRFDEIMLREQEAKAEAKSADKPEKAEKPAKPAKAEAKPADKADKVDKAAEKPAKDTAAKAEKAAKAEPEAKPAKSEKPAKPAKAEQAEPDEAAAEPVDEAPAEAADDSQSETKKEA